MKDDVRTAQRQGSGESGNDDATFHDADPRPADPPKQALLPGLPPDLLDRDEACADPCREGSGLPGTPSPVPGDASEGPSSAVRADQHLLPGFTLPGFTLVALLDMTPDQPHAHPVPGAERRTPRPPLSQAPTPEGPGDDRMRVFAPERPAPGLPPITVVGLGLGETLRPAALRAVRQAEVLGLPRRLMRRFPRHRAQIVPLAAPLEPALQALEEHRRQGRRCVVLADGDPLLYGIGATLARRFGQTAAEALNIVPGVSAMQTACSRLALPWHDVQTLSLHGRGDWFPLAHATLSGRPVSVYTDAARTPDAIARFLLERGVDWYRMAVASSLESRRESVVEISLHEAAERSFVGGETVLLLPCGTPRGPRLGLNESALVVEAGLYTKAAVRAAALSLLRIAPDSTVWDIGSGSGCMALEAAALAVRGRVYAVEQHPDRVLCIRENRRRLGVPHLEVLQASAPLRLDELPDPDAVFLGGGLGGKDEPRSTPGVSGEAGAKARQAARLLLRQATGHTTATRAGLLLDTLFERLRPGGTLVAACTLFSSLQTLTWHLNAHALAHSVTLVQASVSAPLADSLTLKAQNPIFLVRVPKPAATELS